MTDGSRALTLVGVVSMLIAGIGMIVTLAMRADDVHIAGQRARTLSGFGCSVETTRRWSTCTPVVNDFGGIDGWTCCVPSR